MKETDNTKPQIHHFNELQALNKHSVDIFYMTMCDI